MDTIENNETWDSIVKKLNEAIAFYKTLEKAIEPGAFLDGLEELDASLSSEKVLVLAKVNSEWMLVEVSKLEEFAKTKQLQNA